MEAVGNALLGTGFTWAATAAGAAVVYIAQPSAAFLDGSLGFAAGVMLAASYWSLLAPSLELARASGDYGPNGEYAFLPAVIGFLLGAAFVQLADSVMPALGVDSSDVLQHALAAANEASRPGDKSPSPGAASSRAGLRRRTAATDSSRDGHGTVESGQSEDVSAASASLLARWRRTMLLVLAVTLHNIPEGLAVGVAFGSVGSTSAATLAAAWALAIGIGIQNFPEGLAVSIPLHRAGFSKHRSFWYGQLSGMVEPVAGALGAWAVTLAQPLLPYALAFAAGAMIFVVLDDLVPETAQGRNARLAVWGAMAGFVCMMSLDVIFA